MGLRESLTVDWKDKTIEYQNKTIYIVDQFKYNGIEYLYGCDIETINNKNLEVVFLVRVRDDLIEHVEDEELFNELLMHVAG